MAGQTATTDVRVVSVVVAVGSGDAFPVSEIVLSVLLSGFGKGVGACLGGVSRVLPSPLPGIALSRVSAAPTVLVTWSGRGQGVSAVPVFGPILARAEALMDRGAGRSTGRGGVTGMALLRGRARATGANLLQERTLSVPLAVAAAAGAALAEGVDVSGLAVSPASARGVCSGFPMFQGAGVRVDFRVPGSFPPISFKEVFA
jgi:hypothetical protein